MRQIKFRCFRDGQVIQLDQMNTSRHENHDFQKSEDRGILMQFTGLLDKNGKEIWEGDIISFLGYYDYKVVFEDAKFVCYHITHPEIGKWGDLSIMMDPDFAKDEFKVIGNIYENPDLLK